MIELLDAISTPTRLLSEYIAGALARPLPDAVAEKARHHVLDTLAAMVSGSRLPPGVMAIGYAASLGGVPEASVVGASLRTSVVNAALANGMLAHADETDDSHAPSRTHPGCAVIPAALAVAERTHASGRTVPARSRARLRRRRAAELCPWRRRFCGDLAQHAQLSAACSPPARLRARCSASMPSGSAICFRSARSRLRASPVMCAIRITSKRPSISAACRREAA